MSDSPKDIIIEKLQRDLAEKVKIITALSVLQGQNLELRERIQNLQNAKEQLDALIPDLAAKEKIIQNLLSTETENVSLRDRVNRLQYVISDSGLIDDPTSDKQREFNLIINSVYPKLRYMKNMFKSMDIDGYDKKKMSSLLCVANEVKCKMDKVKCFAEKNIKK